MTNGDGVCGFENLDEFKQGQVQSSWITPTPYLFIPVFAKPQTPSPLVLVKGHLEDFCLLLQA